MRRRSYFLFPDKLHLRAVVEQLRSAEIPNEDLHIVAGHTGDAGWLHEKGLPMATREQRQDRLHVLEHRLWRYNLMLFFAAVPLSLTTLWVGWDLSALLSAAVALASLLTGVVWAFVPDISLQQFTAALRHGELLLMVDMERRDLRKVEALVRHNHPEVVLGGSTFLPA